MITQNKESLSIVSALVGKMSDSDLAYFEAEIAKLPGNEIERATLAIAREEIQKRDDHDIARCETEIGERERMQEADLIVESLREEQAEESECDCDEPGCPECDARHEQDDEPRDSMTDAEADADTFASAGWGTDEDYGGGDERM